MRRILLVSSCLVLQALLLGCAGKPQREIGLAPEIVARHEGHIGVVMTVLPKVGVVYPGANCLLCLAAASAMNSSLTTQAHALGTDEVMSYKADVIKELRRKGFEVVDIAEPLDLSKIKRTHGKENDHAPEDFSALKAKYQIDKLCVISVTTLGFIRTYASYIPTSDPQAQIVGSAYLVDLSTNVYDWYQLVNVTRAAEGKWDEPPKYPGLTNAYFQAVEQARDIYVGPFKK